jgi:hypothetical protein
MKPTLVITNGIVLNIINDGVASPYTLNLSGYDVEVNEIEDQYWCDSLTLSFSNTLSPFYINKLPSLPSLNQSNHIRICRGVITFFKADSPRLYVLPLK